MPDDLLRRITPLLDLTSLNSDDTETSIASLCDQAITLHGSVAAICVLPRFVSLVKNQFLPSSIRLATVANFPQGLDSMQAVCDIVRQVIADGADEVDIVLPYRALLAGDIDYVQNFLQTCREATLGKTLKIILETGMLQTAAAISQASELCILAGVDFLKTSTGKVPVGATLPAAELMLQSILKYSAVKVGLKCSGGIRTLAQAQSYLQLVDTLMGPQWLSPATFRFGVSKMF